MSSRHHIDDFMRGRIIGKIEEGRKITDVAREFDIAHSVVSQMYKEYYKSITSDIVMNTCEVKAGPKFPDDLVGVKLEDRLWTAERDQRKKSYWPPCSAPSGAERVWSKVNLEEF
ncbi:hypothetical protein TNCV_2977441 [Trichonephila clavipes]|nr:hypothetical protein TNCV_2977441 [Trichonephila clavipes]